MSCQHCGSRYKGRYCTLCERAIRRGIIRDPDSPEYDTAGNEQLHHECTACGEEYYTDGSEPCPACGVRRRRYIGPLAGGEA